MTLRAIILHIERGRTVRNARGGRRYRRERDLCFIAYGTVCHWCGHDGAGEADHLEPLAVSPGQPIDHRLMRPIHGTSSPCPVCISASTGRARCCNQERGARALHDRGFTSALTW